MVVDVDFRNGLDALVAGVVGKLIHRDALCGSTDGKRGVLREVEGLDACDGHIDTRDIDVSRTVVSCVIVCHQLETLGGCRHEIGANVYAKVVCVARCRRSLVD